MNTKIETKDPDRPRRRWSLWRGLRPGPTARPVALAILLSLVGGTSALAQADPFAWFTHLFQPNPPPSHVMKPIRPRSEIHRAAPKHSSARPKPSSHSGEKAIEKADDKTGAKPSEKAAVAPTYFVAVLGDSLAQMLAQGLTEAFADRPEVAILHKAKENSGLVRDDFYDWTKATQDLLASGEKIDFAIMLIGSNDRQTLRDANGGYEPRSPQWEDAYARRIETIAAMFRDKKIPLIWVGLPVLKSERLSADASAFNELYRENAAKAGATFVDVWEAFADDSGQYNANGPDINGQIVRLRASDGIHFTRAGARKLAHFIEPDIRRNLDEVLPPAPPDIANAPAPSDAEAPASEPTAEPQGEAAVEPVPPAPPPPKPIAGPILPLTGPALAPGAALATKMDAQRPPADKARLRTDQAPQESTGGPPPGRADDFAWPRP